MKGFHFLHRVCCFNSLPWWLQFKSTLQIPLTGCTEVETFYYEILKVDFYSANGLVHDRKEWKRFLRKSVCMLGLECFPALWLLEITFLRESWTFFWVEKDSEWECSTFQMVFCLFFCCLIILFPLVVVISPLLNKGEMIVDKYI